MFALWTITITTCRFVSKLELVLRDTWSRFEKLNVSVLWWIISSQFLQTVVQSLEKIRYDYHSASSTVFANLRISIFNCVGDNAGSVVSQSERVWVLANRRNSRYDICRKRNSAFRWWAPSFVPQWQFNSSTVSRSFLALFTLTDFNFKTYHREFIARLVETTSTKQRNHEHRFNQEAKYLLTILQVGALKERSAKSSF